MPNKIPKSARIYIAGHRGLVGSAILRRLAKEGYTNLLTASRDQLDLRDQAAVNYWFKANRPEYVFLVAGTVGGIWANATRPAEFIYDNMMIHATVVHASYLYNVKKLLYLGSSCIYPRECPQPMREEYLLGSYLEPTNEPYAIAKIAGIKLCQAYHKQYGCNFISAMPTNLYGPNDNFDLENSHVLPAILRKFHLAKLAVQGDGEGIRRDEERFGPIPKEVHEALPGVRLWGTGVARREFLHVDDMAAACVFVMQLPDEQYENACGGGEVSHLNVGCGQDHTIRELAERVRAAVRFEGDVAWDSSRPDGMPQKRLDVSRLTGLGWSPQIELADGIGHAYEWYRMHASRQKGEME
jgi:GDP-L-fucose synthase